VAFYLSMLWLRTFVTLAGKLLTRRRAEEDAAKSGGVGALSQLYDD